MFSVSEKKKLTLTDFLAGTNAGGVTSYRKSQLPSKTVNSRVQTVLQPNDIVLLYTKGQIETMNDQIRG